MNANALNSKGFEIALNLQGHILRTRMWGVWDVEFAKKYRSALNEKIDEIIEYGSVWNIVMDFRRFPPQPESVHTIIQGEIVAAKQRGIQDVVCVQGIVMQTSSCAYAPTNNQRVGGNTDGDVRSTYEHIPASSFYHEQIQQAQGA